MLCNGRNRIDNLLLVSEVVTHAVVHPEPHSLPIDLIVQRAKNLIRVEVTDGGQGFTPIAREPAPADGGYGLYLVDQEADRWGVEVQRGRPSGSRSQPRSEPGDQGPHRSSLCCAPRSAMEFAGPVWPNRPGG